MTDTGLLALDLVPLGTGDRLEAAARAGAVCPSCYRTTHQGKFFPSPWGRGGALRGISVSSWPGRSVAGECRFPVRLTTAGPC